MAYGFNKCTFYFSAESPCSRSEERAYKATGALFAATTAAFWTLGAVDAPRAARRENERRIARRWRVAHPVRAGTLRPMLDVAPNGALVVGLGLTTAH